MLKKSVVETVKSQKSFKSLSLWLSLCLGLAACQQNKQPEPTGTVQVQIPLSASVNGQVEYKLQNVYLQKIESLRNVRGGYAQFYYAPGLKNNSLDGYSPVAYFIEAAQSLFVPKDDLSTQMATLYYHFQSLVQFSQAMGLADVTTQPVQVAIQAKVMDESQGVMLDNAFFDGRSKAFVFVRYSLNDLPISVNGGIVAHEYFHSIFYNLVYEVMKKTNLPVAQKIRDETLHQDVAVTDKVTTQDLFNETYLRGLNEGLADFWAWVYTTDSNFLKWSLPAYSKSRVLNVNDREYWDRQKIENTVTLAFISDENPTSYLGRNAIYQVGTGYARFLKQLSELKSSEQKISLADAKFVVANQLVEFLKTLPVQAGKLTNADVFDVTSLFTFMNQSKSVLSQKECVLIKDYLSFNNTADKYECVVDKNSYKVVKK